KIVNLTQAEFALRVGVSLRALQTYEHAQADVSVEFCKRAFDAFGLDPLWLMTGQGAPQVGAERGGGRPLVQAAYDAVQDAIAQSNEAVSEEKKGWLVQAVHEHLVRANGDLNKVDIPFLMR